MHTEETRNRFIELRAQGRTLAHIAAELRVTTRTLVEWNKQYLAQISDLQSVALEALQARILPSHEQELARLATRLDQVEAVLAKRKLECLSTEFLFCLAASLRAQIRKQCLRPTLTFGNGSRIVAGHFQNESDIDAYLGLEYDVIGIEEATTLTHRKFLDITTCCRSSKTIPLSTPNSQPSTTHWRPRIYSTTNPGGVGHAWYKERYLRPLRENRQSFTRFISARVTDNPFVNSDYRLVLDRLVGWQKRAWLEGDWDIAAGQFFASFRHEIHVVTDFDESRAREWFGALDYGFAHYTVFLLACKDGDGNIFIVDEHARRQWLPRQHTNAMLQMLVRHGLVHHNLDHIFAGADVFSRQSNGRSIADDYRQQYFKLTPANMDRVNGWAEVLRRLGDPGAGIRPSLFIHQRCQRLIETLPNLIHDPNRPEDVLKVDPDEEGHGGDDAADALRYLVATTVPTIKMIRLCGF